jgi:hypothetical protein
MKEEKTMINDLYNNLDSQAQNLDEIIMLATVIRAECGVSDIRNLQNDLNSYVEALENVAKEARSMLKRYTANAGFTENSVESKNVLQFRKD